MFVHSLYSSSEGNACLIYNDETSFMIDAGISFKKMAEASNIEFEPKAVFVSHEHSDHILGAGILGRKKGTKIFIPEASFEKKATLFKNCTVEYITGGDIRVIGDFEITCFSTRHDSQNSVGFIVLEKSTGKKFGYITDTGSFSSMMKTQLIGCDAYLLEANYDPQMLADYDDYIEEHKTRIASPYGHLSNDQTITFIEDSLDMSNTKWVLFGHMSPRTNSPEILMKSIKNRLGHYGDKFFVAPTEEAIEV